MMDVNELTLFKLLAVTRGKEIERLARRIHNLRLRNKAQRVDLEISHESNRQLLQRWDSGKRTLMQAQVQIERLLVENSKVREAHNRTLNRNMELEVLHKITEESHEQDAPQSEPDRQETQGQG